VTVNKAVFTTQPMAEQFGWQGAKHAQKAAPKAGYVEPARLADFAHGATEAHDKTAHTTLDILAGAAGGYLVGKAWSAWRQHLRAP
jgi:hypothetical protein